MESVAWSTLWTVAVTLTAPSVACAGFVGWTGTVRSVGSWVMLDVYAGFDGASQHALNVYGADITFGGATVVQAAGARTWAPVAGSSTFDSADSFVTLGADRFDGVVYAGFDTVRDPSFTNYLTPGATGIPQQAGWYASNPLGSAGGEDASEQHVQQRGQSDGHGNSGKGQQVPDHDSRGHVFQGP